MYNPPMGFVSVRRVTSRDSRACNAGVRSNYVSPRQVCYVLMRQLWIFPQHILQTKKPMMPAP